MTTKSIVEIGLNAPEFAPFISAWEKFQKAAEEQPALWKKIAQSQNPITSNFEKMARELGAQNDALRENREENERHSKHLEKNEQLWHRMSTHSTSLYRNVLGVSSQFLRWTGLLAGAAVGVAAGSLFGVGRLASGISGERQESKSLGLSIGQLRALNIDLGRYGDVQGTAQGILAMESNPGLRGSWTSLGLGAMSHNVMQDLVRYLSAERSFVLRHPDNYGVLAQSMGLLSSLGDLTIMGRTGTPEWLTQTGRLPGDAKRMEITDRSALAASNMQSQFARAWKQMETGLWGALVPLSGPIIKLSQAFTNAAVTILGSPAVKQGIADFSKWITSFSTTLNSQVFANKLKAFTSDTGVVADGVHLMADTFKPFSAAMKGWENIFSWLGKGADAARSGNNIAWNLGTAITNAFTGNGGANGVHVGGSGANVVNRTAGELADWYAKTGVSAAQLRAADLAGVSAGRISATAPQIKGNLAPANVNLSITFQNLPGANPIITVNGLAGH